METRHGRSHKHKGLLVKDKITDPDMPSIGFFSKWTLVTAVLFGVFIIVPTTLVLAMQPAWMGFQRGVMKQSHQYVEAKESMLLQWVAQYDALEVDALKYEANGHEKLSDGIRLQQESLLARIKTEAQRIPADAVPTSVKDFLEKH